MQKTADSFPEENHQHPPQKEWATESHCCLKNTVLKHLNGKWIVRGNHLRARGTNNKDDAALKVLKKVDSGASEGWTKRSVRA